MSANFTTLLTSRLVLTPRIPAKRCNRSVTTPNCCFALRRPGGTRTHTSLRHENLNLARLPLRHRPIFSAGRRQDHSLRRRTSTVPPARSATRIRTESITGSEPMWSSLAYRAICWTLHRTGVWSPLSELGRRCPPSPSSESGFQINGDKQWVGFTPSGLPGDANCGTEGDRTPAIRASTERSTD